MGKDQPQKTSNNNIKATQKQKRPTQCQSFLSTFKIMCDEMNSTSSGGVCLEFDKMDGGFLFVRK